jgi:AcrR family transcriptional regulator
VSRLPRVSLNARQSETVERLFHAATEELEVVGQEALTIRTVATRAGVSPATAYTYFASKDHLFAELFWRLLSTDPGPRLTGRNATARLQQTTRHLAELIAGAPATAAAATRSLLGTDPDVARLRLVIGGVFVQRFRTAIGDGADPRVLETLALAFSGALLQTGMGIDTYEDLANRLDHVVAIIMKGNQ